MIEPDRERAHAIIEGLQETGTHEVLVFGDVTGVDRRIAAANPDVVLIDIANPDRDALEELTLATNPAERPVAMFVDENDPQIMKAAIEAGVSAYVVDGLAPSRIKPILDAAIARFNQLSRIRSELEATKQALEERKVVDRAKGLLMKAKDISEEEAYRLLRSTAMEQGRKIVDVARALVTAAFLLK